MGLAIATMTGYAKPAHSAGKKHTTMPVKRVKIHTRHTVKRLKPATKKHLSNVSFKQVLRKRKSRHLDPQSPEKILLPLSTGNPQLILKNPEGDPALDLIENNARIHALIIAENKNNFRDAPVTDAAPKSLVSTQGIINSSLYLAGQEAGLSDDLMVQLTSIFAWDVDFATSLHSGDQFTVIYENSKIGDSQIVAAEFVTQGKILTAIRYKDNEGNINYYSPEGKAMRKAFLSTPVDFVRISSHFNIHRKHPVLNRIRAHKGVDYAARTGTPVKAAGNGKISFLGRQGGYGKVMILEHGAHFETLYAHLSNFRKSLQEGDLVRQGEVIGYVGQTGLATGPHLHYEFRIDGVHHNPETLNQDPSLPLNRELLANFKAQARPLLAQLYQAKAHTLFAKNQYDINN
jgi:murein DD-endopeptidase MepM/ murein hydrolase activator NlpD